MESPKGWKVHFFTENVYVPPNSEKVWFHSACKLVFSGTPTERSQNKDVPVTCLRCIKQLTKENPRGIQKSASKA